MLVIEGEALLIPTTDNHAGQSVLISAERIHLRFNIAPGAIAKGEVTPFILGPASGALDCPHQQSAWQQLALVQKQGRHGRELYVGAGVMFALDDLHLPRRPGVRSPQHHQRWLLGRLRVDGGHRRHARRAARQRCRRRGPLVKDADGDGIPDAQDNCPHEAGPADKGVPGQGRRRRRIVEPPGQAPRQGRPPERDGFPEEDRDQDGISAPRTVPRRRRGQGRFKDADGCPDPGQRQGRHPRQG